MVRPINKFQEFFLHFGFWLLVVVLLADCFHDLWEIVHYDWYRVMQADVPDWLVCVRYVVSASLRVGMLWALAGVISRQEQHRRLLIGLCIFNALTFFLHHRYESFIYISNYLGTNTEDFSRTVIWFGHHVYLGAAARMFDAWLEEVLLSLAGLVFFIHPQAKRLFR